jgi:hypothetical protein
MSGKLLQLSPRASTHVTRKRFAFRDSRNAAAASAVDTGFIGTWFDTDDDIDESSAYGRTMWGAISGLALSVVVSASFWAGIAWVAVRVWG